MFDKEIKNNTKSRKQIGLSESIINNPIAFQPAKVPDKTSIRPSSYKVFKSNKKSGFSKENKAKELANDQIAEKRNNMPSDLASAILKYTGKNYGTPRKAKEEKKVASSKSAVDKKERMKILLLKSNNLKSNESDDELSQDEFKNEKFVDAKESFDEGQEAEQEKEEDEANGEDESNDDDFDSNDEESESDSISESERESESDIKSKDLKNDLKNDTLTKHVMNSAKEDLNSPTNEDKSDNETHLPEDQIIDTKIPLSEFYDLNELSNDTGSNGSTRINKSWNKFAQNHNSLGLLNHGVTCYMNSAVQALCHIPSLAHYLSDIANDKYRSDIKPDSVSAVLASTIFKMYRVGHERKLMHINPKKLCNRLEDINCMMSEWQQEDSHEYLMSLMSRLQEDSTPSGVKLNKSIIYDIFGGLLDQSVICKNCGNISITQQEFYDLSLTLDNRKKRSSLMIEPQQLFELKNQIDNCKSSSNSSKIQLSDLLKQKFLNAQEDERRSRSQTPETNESNTESLSNNNLDSGSNENENSSLLRTYSIENSIKDFFTPEIIKTDKRDQSGYTCEKCLKKSNAIKISTISRSPESLSIHLKRFRFNGQQSQKVKANVTYPEYLDLTEYTTSMTSPTMYKLTSVIVHQGRSVSSGHYIAHCRQQDGSWATYDDEYVNKVRPNVALNDPGAYVLIYERLTHRSLINSDNERNIRKRSLNNDHQKNKVKKRKA